MRLTTTADNLTDNTPMMSAVIFPKKLTIKIFVI